MAIDWNKLDERVKAERARLNNEYAKMQPTLPKAAPTLPKAPQKTLFSPSVRRIGQQIAQPQREKIAAKTYEDFDTPGTKFLGNAINSFLPVNTNKNFHPAIKANEKEFTSGASATAGKVVGTAAQFAIPYMGASKGIGTAVTKLPKIASMGKFGQGVARSVATDLAVGLPLNVNYAFNKEGLRGKEAVKSIGVNTAIDLIAGGILEAVPLILKSGKKVASKADFDALPVPEKQEVVLRLTGPTEPQKLLSEGINWREPIRPDFYVNRGGVASPNMGSVQIAGELPAPARINPSFNPTRRKLSDPYTDFNKEYQRMVESVADYIRNYKGKGVQVGVVPKNSDELMRDGAIRYAQSDNDLWYRDFFKAHGRAPLKSEAEDITKELVDDSLRRGSGEFLNEDLYDLLKYAEYKDTPLPRINKEVPKVIQPPQLPRATREAPFTVTRGEMSSTMEVPRKYPANTTEVKPGIPAQAPTAPVQPILPQKGTEIPKERAFAQNGLKSVGADVNLNKPKMKVSKVRANTIENSPMYSKAKKFMDSKDYEYEVISEKRSLAEAAQRLATDFEGEVKDLPNKANFDGVDLDTSMGIAEQYIKEAEASGDWSKVNQWSKLIQEKGTQGGQLIQAFAKYSRTPEGAVIKGQQTVDAAIRQIAKKNPKLLELTEQEVKDILEALKKKQAPTVKGYQKIADDIRKLSEEGKLTEEAIRELVRKKNGIPVLDDTDIKNIYEAMKETENYPEGSYLRRAYQAKAEQIISNKVPKEFRDKFRALQRLSMMTSLRTFGRNVWGNIILGVPEHIKDIPGTAIDKLVSLKTGQRTTSFGLGNLRAEAQGFKQGLSEWRQDIKLGVDTSPSRGQLELPRGKTFQDKGIGKALNFLDNILIRGLQLGDRPFYQAAFNSRIEELRKLGITGEEAEKAARLFALERVFQNDSALSKGLQAVRQGMNDMVGGFPLGDLLIPFAQTPANILDKLLDYSPAGLGKALFHLGTTAGKGTFDQKLFVDRLARTFTGAGISLLTYALMEKGLISWNLSDSKDVRNAQTLQGQQAYSIKIGDTWYSFDWAQPIAGIIAGTVDAIKAGADSDDIIQATSEGAVAGIDTVFNQSVLQGLANLMSGYSPAMGIARSLMSSTSQATPTGMGQIARIIDPIVRETYDPNPVVRQGKKLVARIPFASRTLPAKIDVAGRVVKQSQGRGVGARMWENLLSPGLRRDETHDPVNAELLRLQSQTGNNAVLLNTAPKIFTGDGKKYILTSDEYVTYQKTMGQEAYSKIQKLMNAPEYRRMSDDEKAKAIKDIHEEAIQKARYEFYDNRGLPVTLALDKDYQEKFRGLKGQMTDKRFYAAVTDMKGKSRDIEKAFAAEQRGRVSDRFFEAFKISEESVEKARALKSAGLTADQYTKAMDGVKDMESDKLPNGKAIDNSLSKKKKAYIDSAFPNASNEQLKLLYELAGVSKTVGHYRPRFE